MKTGIWILTVAIAANAWAQSPAVKPQSMPTPGATQPQAGATHLVRKLLAPVAQPQDQSAKKPSPAVAPNAPATEQAASGKQVSGTAAKPAAAGVKRGRRDPFVSPIVERARFGPACTGTGKRCLYVGDLSLVGIVQSADGVIAVVSSGKRTYFLREHDPLADGEVEKITGDAITMRQRSSDFFGKIQTREVTRKLGGPAV